MNKQQYEHDFLKSIEASIPIVFLVSLETLKIHGLVIHAAKKYKRELYIWNCVEGLKRWNFEERTFEIEDEDLKDPQSILEWYESEENENKKLILLLEDFHPFIQETLPHTIRRLRNIYYKSQINKEKTLVISQPVHYIPPEIDKEVDLIEIPYPNLEDLERIYYKVCNKFGISDNEPPDLLIEAALGLTIMEAERAFSKAFAEAGKLTNEEVSYVIKEKERIIKKSGFLEYYHPDVTINDVGGLENLKDWLRRRGKAFSRDALDYGLNYPKGLLLLGIPGTGKSLVAKAVASEWQFPLLRLDMGKVFGGIVGESESNIRRALQIAEAIAPSILWIDEIEKGLSGASSSSYTDGGTTARVLGTFLTWMQEKQKPVFVIATANDISQLPPELLRKGRVDEIFFVDLPSKKERKEILKIHLQKRGIDPDKFDLNTLAEHSIGFSGAELEEAVKEALFIAYDEGKYVTTEHIKLAIQNTYPLSKTMAEVINNLRKWAAKRAVPASKEKPEPLEVTEQEKIPRLKQETYSNPFIDK